MSLKVKTFDSFLIRKTRSRVRPSNFLYIDTETRTEQEDTIIKHRMKMAWTCHVRKRPDRNTESTKWFYWENPLDMQQYIESLARVKTTLYIIAHNVFFDLQASDFYYWFTKQGWKLDFVYDKGLVYILSISKDKKRIRCISSTNFFQCSLKQLGKMVGLEKLDVDFEESTHEELKTYCHRDVEIVKLAIEQYLRFLDVHGFGNFMLTKASQAFTAYRTRFLSHKIYTHRDEELSEFEKEAYFGGRVECFQIGEVKNGPFISLDVNSMYSFVMRTFSYPTKVIDVIKNPDYDQIRVARHNNCVVAKVYLETDEPAYPLRKNNKIIFPVGRFPVYLCTEGLNYAVNHNHLVNVEEMAVYEKDHIFDDYVDYLYPLKDTYNEEGNLIWRQLVKDFLNGLYGKFAQKTALTEIEEDITFDGYYREEILDLVTGKKEIITKLFNKTFIEWGDKTGKNSFIAIAAHVTEYSRFYLYKLMKEVGLNNVLYVDTDSLKIRQKHRKYLADYIDENRIGGLKIEEKFKRFVIHAPKDYETEKHVIMKGVPSRAELTPEGAYKYIGFLKQDSHLRNQITRYFITKEVTKTLKREYNKGIVLDSGKVIPFKVDIAS